MIDGLRRHVHPDLDSHTIHIEPGAGLRLAPAMPAEIEPVSVIGSRPGIDPGTPSAALVGPIRVVDFSTIVSRTDGVIK